MTRVAIGPRAAGEGVRLVRQRVGLQLPSRRSRREAFLMACPRPELEAHNSVVAGEPDGMREASAFAVKVATPARRLERRKQRELAV